MRRGWVEEHNTLGKWGTDGRRIKKCYYTTIPDGRRHIDDECGPFPPADMMISIAGSLARVGLGTDEKWPRAMINPALSLESVWIDVMTQGESAFERHARLQTMEAWARQGRITIDFFVNNQKNRSTAVVKFGQYERREDASDFPSPEMVANIALALGAGVDQQ